MEGMVSPTDQQTLVTSFLEVAQGQTAATARQFLQVWLTVKKSLFYSVNQLSIQNCYFLTSGFYVIGDFWIIVALRSMWCVLIGYKLETWGSSSAVFDWEWNWGGASAGASVFHSTFRECWCLGWSVSYEVMLRIELCKFIYELSYDCVVRVCLDKQLICSLLHTRLSW